MASERDNGVASDADTSEKPVREQLKKASISTASGENAHMAVEESIAPPEVALKNGGIPGTSETRGRLQKKRSFEEFEAERQEGRESESTQRHNRKRSRDSTAEENELNNGQRKSGERSREEGEGENDAASNGKPTEPVSQRPGTPEQSGAKRGEAAVEEMTSPKFKKTRLHPSAEENGVAASNEAESNGSVATEPSVLELSKEEKPTTTILPTSGFANTSASSPFASLASPKSPLNEPAQTSESAFEASGFSTFAASSTTGFGTIGKTSGGFGTGGGFGSSSTTTKTVEDRKPTETAFGGALGQKPAFGTTASSGIGFGSGAPGFGGKLGQSIGFGGGGGGFGGLGAGAMTSFASNKPSVPFASSSKAVRSFGAPAAVGEDDEPDEDGDDEAGVKSPLSQDSDKQDERFHAQELETGEEDETTEYSGRAKLYNFAAGADGKKEWKERGLGVVRLNVKNPPFDSEEEVKPTARLLMRAEGSHRVILNTPVKKEIKFGSASGGLPQGGYILFMGTVEGKANLEMLQLKMRQSLAEEMYHKIAELQSAM